MYIPSLCITHTFSNRVPKCHQNWCHGLGEILLFCTDLGIHPELEQFGNRQVASVASDYCLFYMFLNIKRELIRKIKWYSRANVCHMVLMTFLCIKYTAHVGTGTVMVGELRLLKNYVQWNLVVANWVLSTTFFTNFYQWDIFTIQRLCLIFCHIK